MADYATRAEVHALAARLDEIIEATGCTTVEGMEADKKLRKFIAVWDSEAERRDRETMHEILDWWRRSRANRDESRQRWVDLGVQTGVYSAIFALLSGFLGGAVWVVITLLRWVHGGAP